MHRTVPGLLVLAAGLLAAAVVPCAAGSPPEDAPAADDSSGPQIGPQIGNVTYRAEIRTTSEGEDVDAYSGRLARGERLSVKLVSPFLSGLLPAVELLGPDGTPRDVPLRSTRLGRVLEIRSLEVPETGRWTVRVSPLLGTYGRYALKFAVRPAPPATVKIPADVTGEAGVVDLRVDALEGAGFELRASGRDGTPEVGAILDPSGADVPGVDGPAADEATVRRGVVSLRIDTISAGDGLYAASVRLPAGHRGATVSVRMTAPERPRGSLKLLPDEPWIEPRLSPIRGAEGVRVRIRGRHLSYAPPPRVLFGGVQGTDVIVDPSTTFLDVEAPALPEGATYSVSVVLADGQVTSRPDYYYAVPTPRVDDLVGSDGLRVRSCSTLGGRAVRMLGSGYQTGMFIRVGTSDDVLPQIRDPGRADFALPPQPAGFAELRILDAYRHETVAAFEIEYKAPPSLDEAPYVPAAVPADGSVKVSVRGSGFEFGDEILFDGAPVPTMWWTSSELEFRPPAGLPGAHTVAVRDRVGTVTNGPDLLFLDPPLPE